MPSAADYLPRLKDRLLLDAADPIFSGPLFVGEGGEARKRLRDLVGAKSEAAITWSVFRAFQRLPAEEWTEALLGKAIDGAVEMRFWEGSMDLVLEAPGLTAVVEGKYTSDIAAPSPRQGDQIARCLDAALELAGAENAPHFVLITDDYAHPQADPMVRWMGPAPPSPAGEAPALPVPYVPTLQYEILMPRYMNEPGFLTSRLPNRRPEEVQRLLGHIRWLSWADLIDGVLDRSASFTPEQHLVLRRLVDWLRDKRLLHKGS